MHRFATAGRLVIIALAVGLAAAGCIDDDASIESRRMGDDGGTVESGGTARPGAPSTALADVAPEGQTSPGGSPSVSGSATTSSGDDGQGDRESDGGGDTTVASPRTTATDSDGAPRPDGAAPSSAQPTFPIRAAFFYPWFPNAWSQKGIDPFTNFEPSLGRYRSSDEAVVRRQLALATDAHIDAFIASWWGPGHHTDDALGAVLAATPGSSTPEFRWAVYYENEGQGDPPVSELVSDLEYLAANYLDDPSYLRVNDRPVVFVWADGADGRSMVSRWEQARERLDIDLYLVLKVFSGFREVADRADSWHQYGPAIAYDDQDTYSATVSPGFWLVGEGERLVRDVARFEADVRRMNEASVDWQLITSWNEWGEGTSVEPAAEFGSAYLDLLAEHPPAASPSAPAPSAEPTEEALSFVVGADLGATSATRATLSAMADLDPRFALMLGDLGYDDVEDESEWCDVVDTHLGSVPTQLLVGNHEDDDREDGYIGAFADCLPDRLDSTGVYGAQYHFDVDGLLRVIMLGADTRVDGVEYDYEAGSPYLEWLVDAIREARADGIQWIVVGMHKVCLSAGTKPCEISPDLLQALIDERVDLVLHGHEHNYQRSSQVDCFVVGAFDRSCVVDDGVDGLYRRGAGPVWVVSGVSGGGGLTDIDTDDPEFPYLAAWMGGNHPLGGRGFLAVEVRNDHMDVQFVGSTTTFSDQFTIR